MIPGQPVQTEGQPFETYPLFATPLWLATYPEASRLNPVLRSHAIAAMESDRGISVQKRSNRRGWRGAGFNLEGVEMWAPLAVFVRKVLGSLLRPELDVEILSNGVNVHLEGGFNFSHVHSGCVVSGVYYISCPPGGGDLVFEDPRSQAIFADCNSLFVQDQGDESISLTPSEGQLVLFPSWLSHRVEPSGAFEPRISLPINVVLCQGHGAAARANPAQMAKGSAITAGRSASTRGFAPG